MHTKFCTLVEVLDGNPKVNSWTTDLSNLDCLTCPDQMVLIHFKNETKFQYTIHKKANVQFNFTK